MAYDENIYARIVSGELSEEEIEGLKKSGEWEEVQSILKATDKFTLPKHDKEKGFADLINKRQEIKPAKTKRLNPLLIGIAASLLIMLGFIFLFNDATTTIKAELAAIHSATLPDGSTITLNDGSNLQFNERNWDSQRKVMLKGEAYFDVEKGNEFIVQTSQGTVTVLGTQFNVRSWGDNFYVECYEGSVEVTYKSEKSVLSKGESVHIIDQKMNSKNTIQNIEPLWQNGTLRFHGEKLTEVFKEIERQFNVSIDYKIDSRKFSGSFNEKKLEEALREVCGPMGLKFQIDSSKKVTISN